MAAAFPMIAFKTKIKHGHDNMRQFYKCRNAAKRDGRTPDGKCLKHRSNAENNLKDARQIYHDRRKSWRNKEKWSASEDKYFARELARLAAEVYPPAPTSLVQTKASLVTAVRMGPRPAGTSAGLTATHGDITVTPLTRVGTATGAAAALPSTVASVIATLPTDPVTGEAQVAAYEFTPSTPSTEEAVALEEGEGEGGMLAMMKARPLLTVVGVAVVGGILYTIFIKK